MGIYSGTIIIVVLIVAFFLTWFFSERSKEKERLLLIEKDIDLSKLPERGFRINFPWLKIGILITMSVIGLIIGIILYNLDIIDSAEPIVSALLFGGIGMIIAHYVDKPKA